MIGKLKDKRLFLNQAPLYPAPFVSGFERFSRIQKNSLRNPMQNSFSNHPQTAQGEQGQPLSRILGQVLVAQIAIAERALDHSKRLFRFGMETGLALLDWFNKPVSRPSLVRT